MSGDINPPDVGPKPRPERITRSTGTGVGKGHGRTTSVQFPRIVEHEVTGNLRRWRNQGMIQKDTRVFRMGKISILKAFDEKGGHHLSIGHPTRLPSWDEVAHVREWMADEELIPNEVTLVMVLPPREEWINIHNFVFQLVEPRCMHCEGDAVSLHAYRSALWCEKCIEEDQST